MKHAGFTLVELLVAATLVLIVTAGILAVAARGASGSGEQAAAVDIQQRLRAAIEAIGANLLSAGAGPVNGVHGRPVGAVTASLLPFRTGARGDPAGTVRADALTILTARGSAASVALSVPWAPGALPATLSVLPGCPAGDLSCGVLPGEMVLLLDGRGQSDLFRVDAVTGSQLTLTPRGIVSGRAYPAGSLVVPVTVVHYLLKAGAPAEGGQLVSGDGDSADMPLVDHVTDLTFTLLAEPTPPSVTGDPGAPRATYGPSPPPLSHDDPDDAWPAGENCTFTAVPTGHVSRLVPLDSGTGLVALTEASLTDGPWCPDALSPARHDADLLRVRAVRVSLRLEAGSASLRGRDTRLFAHPGLSLTPSSSAADVEFVFDVVPRALQQGR